MTVNAAQGTYNFPYSHTVGFLANQGPGVQQSDRRGDRSGRATLRAEPGGAGGRHPAAVQAGHHLHGGRGVPGRVLHRGHLRRAALVAELHCIGLEGLVYIPDEALNHVQVFTPEGVFLKRWGVAGSAAGELNRPSCLGVDAEDNLLISDSLNHRVQRFSRDGEFLGEWGRFGSGDGELNMPWGLALDRKGYVYVADWRNDRVQKFDPQGGFMTKWGGPGSGLFNRPAAVAVDDEGLLYVADWGNERVQILHPEGEVLGSIRGTRWTRAGRRTTSRRIPRRGRRGMRQSDAGD